MVSPFYAPTHSDEVFTPLVQPSSPKGTEAARFVVQDNAAHLLMVKSSDQVLLKTLVTKKMHPCGFYTPDNNANITSSLAKY